MEKRPAWKDVESAKVQHANSDLLVTHVNHTHDLLRAEGMEVSCSDRQNSAQWLRMRSLESHRLTLPHLLHKGTVVTSPGPDVQEHLHFSAAVIAEFETKLHQMIALYHQRIKWLLQDSRKLFGLVQGTRVAVIVDSSDANCVPGRLSDLRTSLLQLVDEQLCYRKQLYLLSCGSKEKPLWDTVRHVNLRIVNEARQWANELAGSGGSNVLAAVKRVLCAPDVSSVLLVLGSCPDQSPELVCGYVEESLLGRSLPFHTVAFDCSSHDAQTLLGRLAKMTGGRYHCYSSGSQEAMYSSTDIKLLVQESQTAMDILGKIREMRQGILGETIVSIMQQVSLEAERLPASRSLPRPPGHESPLVLAPAATFLPSTSVQWLQRHGLKGQKLGLYQVLAPNAFSTRHGFVPILQKSVTATVHAKAMTQFEWHNGTVKNMHVDLPTLHNYQKQLGQAVRTYEQRVSWLSSGSRRIWGTVCEMRLAVLVDLSEMNANYLVHVQHSMRLLLQTQLTGKESFNIITFGMDIQAFRPSPVPPSPENLQAAWSWVLEWRCGGGRDLLGALRLLLEDPEGPPEGIYVFTSGVPDQDLVAVCGYVEEANLGQEVRLHACLFSAGGSGSGGGGTSGPACYASGAETAEALRALARAGRGRLHCFSEQGITDSDDIQLLLAEMETAVAYSRKCGELIKSLKQRAGRPLSDEEGEGGQEERSAAERETDTGAGVERVAAIEDKKMLALREQRSPARLSQPRPTALSLARVAARDGGAGVGAGGGSGREEPGSGGPLVGAWRPASARAVIPARPPECPPRKGASADRPRRRRGSGGGGGRRFCGSTSHSAFYTEDGNHVGVVYKSYAQNRSVRKAVPDVTLPPGEDALSSSQWLKRFGLKKLRLDVERLMLGLDCHHRQTVVRSLRKSISAKYCSIFPSVRINGKVRHLQFGLHELEEYAEVLQRVLRRYLARLHWLLSGSRCVFGVVLEANVCLLIDVSGSMTPHLCELQQELASLVWDQLRHHCTRFNMIRFSGDVACWQERPVEVSDESCRDAVRWVSSLVAHGGTDTLGALRAAFSQEGVQGLYVVSDGRPDTSGDLVLQEAKRLGGEHGSITIHTVAYHCHDPCARHFLRRLAVCSGGRFHSWPAPAPDAQLAAHRMLAGGFSDEHDPILPAFEGDDLRRLADEIARARAHLTQARGFQVLLHERRTNETPAKDRHAHTEGSVWEGTGGKKGGVSEGHPA
ncbi:von Willebrand factor A domain-containing protein 3A isoform X2 [Petromyzon marinus]|uniref:von Willebrand factor A domain-containing protein 3A isoform X2 n=1 Tax=Petromyzon marinus TaxID=7757 RepID=UPI003F6EA6BF